MLFTSGVPGPAPGGVIPGAGTGVRYPGPVGGGRKVVGPGPGTPMCALPHAFLDARQSSVCPPAGAPGDSSGTVRVMSVNPTARVSVSGLSRGEINGRFFTTRPKIPNARGWGEVVRGGALRGGVTGLFEANVFIAFSYVARVIPLSLSHGGGTEVAPCPAPVVPGR